MVFTSFSWSHIYSRGHSFFLMKTEAGWSSHTQRSYRMWFLYIIYFYIFSSFLMITHWGWRLERERQGGVLGLAAYLPTTMSVNSNPFLTDFLWTWLGRLAKPTYPDCSGAVNCNRKKQTIKKTILITAETKLGLKHSEQQSL